MNRFAYKQTARWKLWRLIWVYAGKLSRYAGNELIRMAKNHEELFND